MWPSTTLLKPTFSLRAAPTSFFCAVSLEQNTLEDRIPKWFVLDQSIYKYTPVPAHYISQHHCDFVGRIGDLNSFSSSSYLICVPDTVLIIHAWYGILSTAARGGGTCPGPGRQGVGPGPAAVCPEDSMKKSSARAREASRLRPAPQLCSSHFQSPASDFLQRFYSFPALLPPLPLVSPLSLPASLPFLVLAPYFLSAQPDRVSGVQLTCLLAPGVQWFLECRVTLWIWAIEKSLNLFISIETQLKYNKMWTFKVWLTNRGLCVHTWGDGTERTEPRSRRRSGGLSWTCAVFGLVSFHLTGSKKTRWPLPPLINLLENKKEQNLQNKQLSFERSASEFFGSCSPALRTPLSSTASGERSLIQGCDRLLRIFFKGLFH